MNLMSYKTTSLQNYIRVEADVKERKHENRNHMPVRYLVPHPITLLNNQLSRVLYYKIIKCAAINARTVDGIIIMLGKAI